MKNTTTEVGRTVYGEKFWNLDDITMLHACSLKDPRCDQGHYGPHFMTFHRAYLLRLENALLAVDKDIIALPYWDYSHDTRTGKYYQDEENYIFSDNYFGDIQGNASENYAVTNGLFARWPITEYTQDRFGNTSKLNVTCTKNEYFKGTVSSVCARCCGNEDCTCNQTADIFPHYLRDHDDCTPYVARNPNEVPEIFGTNELLGTNAEFEACTKPNNIKTQMQWQNCIELEQLGCILSLGGIDCEKSIVDSLPFPFNETKCENCTLKGFYFEGKKGTKKTIQSLHSQAHIRLGRDLQDVTTSPNDCGPFSGYHANVDRNHMTWMMNTYYELSEVNWEYPESQDDWSFENVDHLSGPFSSYDYLVCSDSSAYTEYNITNAWLKGTLANDTCNEGFPFDDLWDQPPKNGEGYTHQEILYWSDPSRTVYTYDTLAKYYCKIQGEVCAVTSDCCDKLSCKPKDKVGKRCSV